MIFPVLEADSIVQVNDKFRLSALKSYISKDESPITKVEIKPESSAPFIEVTGNSSKDYYLDWQYQSAGEKTATLKITTDNDGEEDIYETATKVITSVTEAEDYLFSKDEDLITIESDIMRYVPDGRSSFKYMHREAQRQILEWLYISGYRKKSNQRIQKEDFRDIAEIKYWSKFLTMQLICFDLKKIKDDIWEQRAKRAEAKAQKFARTVSIKFDYNGDGENDSELNTTNFEWNRR